VALATSLRLNHGLDDIKETQSVLLNQVQRQVTSIDQILQPDFDFKAPLRRVTPLAARESLEVIYERRLVQKLRTEVASFINRQSHRSDELHKLLHDNLDRL
jgi:hypothetical protein